MLHADHQPYRVFTGTEARYNKLLQKEIKRIERGLKRLHIPPYHRVIDVGCGDGKFTNLISKLYDVKVTGIDSDSSKIEKTKTSFPEIEFITGSAYDYEEELLSKNDIFLCIRVINDFTGSAGNILSNLYLYPEKRFIFYFAKFETEDIKGKNLYLYRTPRDIRKKVLKPLKPFFRIKNCGIGFYEIRPKKNYLLKDK